MVQWLVTEIALQRTWVQLTLHMISGWHPPVTQVPENSTPSSGFQWIVHTCVYTHTQGYIHVHIMKRKIQFLESILTITTHTKKYNKSHLKINSEIIVNGTWLPYSTSLTWHPPLFFNTISIYSAPVIFQMNYVTKEMCSIG